MYRKTRATIVDATNRLLGRHLAFERSRSLLRDEDTTRRPPPIHAGSGTRACRGCPRKTDGDRSRNYVA